MPINILLTFIIGSALGWIIIQITKTPPNLKGLILGCCSAGKRLFMTCLPVSLKESNDEWLILYELSYFQSQIPLAL